MAKASGKKMVEGDTTPAPRFRFGSFLRQAWLPVLLGLITFVVYAPSLAFGFVYDTRRLILEEGFITSISNLPAVFTLKVLGMSLMLSTRPA